MGQFLRPVFADTPEAVADFLATVNISDSSAYLSVSPFPPRQKTITKENETFRRLYVRNFEVFEIAYVFFEAETVDTGELG